jgi:SAM-dependent methyltransferase
MGTAGNYLHPFWHITRTLFSYTPFLEKWALQKIYMPPIVRPQKAYEVWLRHLSHFAKGYDFSRSTPETIAELGPGDSLGVCLCALLSGFDKVYALDVVRPRNISVKTMLDYLDALAALFEERYLLDRGGHATIAKTILAPDRLKENLSKDRLNAVRKTLSGAGSDSEYSIEMKYSVPWDAEEVLEEASLDFLISYAVLEHVSDPDNTYQHMAKWLKPGGLASHAIDYDCHGTAWQWNGHWKYSDFVWKTCFVGKKPYLINRLPRSAHIGLFQKHGFRIIAEKKSVQRSTVTLGQLAPECVAVTAEDLHTSGSFLLCRKS